MFRSLQKQCLKKRQIMNEELVERERESVSVLLLRREVRRLVHREERVMKKVSAWICHVSGPGLDFGGKSLFSRGDGDCFDLTARKSGRQCRSPMLTMIQIHERVYDSLHQQPCLCNISIFFFLKKGALSNALQNFYIKNCF